MKRRRGNHDTTNGAPRRRTGSAVAKSPPSPLNSPVPPRSLAPTSEASPSVVEGPQAAPDTGVAHLSVEAALPEPSPDGSHLRNDVVPAGAAGASQPQAIAPVEASAIDAIAQGIGTSTELIVQALHNTPPSELLRKFKRSLWYRRSKIVLSTVRWISKQLWRLRRSGPIGYIVIYNALLYSASFLRWFIINIGFLVCFSVILLGCWEGLHSLVLPRRLRNLSCRRAIILATVACMLASTIRAYHAPESLQVDDLQDTALKPKTELRVVRCYDGDTCTGTSGLQPSLVHADDPSSLHRTATRMTVAITGFPAPFDTVLGKGLGLRIKGVGM